MHRRSNFFILLAVFVVLFFNPFSSFVNHGRFWAQRVKVLGTTFFKTRPYNIIKKVNAYVNSLTREKTMPVN
jgi:hypothetical protein